MTNEISRFWESTAAPRLVWIGLTALCMGSLAGCRDTDSKTNDERPNVVLIIVDTLRPDYLGSYGFEADTSPNLDALAEESVVFERAVSASTFTAPSHASIMTSRYVREHSIGALNGGTRLVGLETLASTFRDAGYDTAAFISNSIIKRRIGLDYGFDLYDDVLPQAERNRPYIFERTAEVTTERAVDWLDARTDRPYFLWVHYQDPHGPYTPPPEIARQFDVEPEPGERPLPILKQQHGHGGIPAYQVLPGLRYASEYRGRYAGEIRHFDDQLGHLLKAVEESEAKAQPIILLTADHAESLGEANSFFTHGTSAAPEVSRVPFLLRAPGLSPGRSEELVHHVDVMPTLLDLADMPVPDGLRGLPLGRLLGSEQSFPSRTVYSDSGNEVAAYQRDGFVRVSQLGRLFDGKPARWRAFEWFRDGRWSPTALDESLRPAIAAYLATQTPTVSAGERESGDIERLRALGYVDPGQ